MMRSPCSTSAKSAMARDTARPSLRAVGSLAELTMPLAGRALYEREESEYAVPRGPLHLHPRHGPLDRGRTRDVAVYPSRVAHELAKEERGRDRPAPAVAHLLHVGHVALDVLAQLLDEWHVPHRF